MEVAGVPPVNVQFHAFGASVELSVKRVRPPVQTCVYSAVNAATGGKSGGQAERQFKPGT